MFQGWLYVHEKVSDHGGGRHVSHIDVASVVFGRVGQPQPPHLEFFHGSILSLNACCLRFALAVTAKDGRVEVQLALHPPHRSGLAAFPHPALGAIMTCAARLHYDSCDRQVPAQSPAPALPQCALATGPLPSTRSSLALTASSFAVSSVLPGHPTAHILASHDSCVIRLVARGPPLLLTRRFRANMSSPMFRGRLCVHKEVYDHGGGQRIWHIDTSPVAFDSLDNLGLHEFVALSRLNTLSKRLLFTLHPSVTGEDAKLATGLRAPDFPGRTFTGKSTSALHGALPSHFSQERL